MFLTVSNVDVCYPGNAKPAINGVSLQLKAGQIGVLIGPSGCGKTSLLRAIAGLEPVAAGTVQLSNRVVSQPGLTAPPEKRRMGMVFQDYALFPHLSVAGNIAFGLHGQSASSKTQRIAEVLQLVGLEAEKDRFPHELSGGQQQRVFLARALAQEADLYFMDEPFAGVDIATETAIIELLREMRNDGKTVVVVHHDLQSAAEYFNWTILINTRLIASGPTAQVLTNELLQKTYGGKLDVLSQMQDIIKTEAFSVGHS